MARKRGRHNLATKRLRPSMHLRPQHDAAGMVRQVIERPAGKRRLPRVLAQRPRCPECGTSIWRTVTSIGDNALRIAYCECEAKHNFSIEWEG